MTKAELLKKDWQLLTAYSNISTLSKLDTILENQAVIISHIQNIPVAKVTKKMKEHERENYVQYSKLVKNNIPDYDDVKIKYKK